MVRRQPGTRWRRRPAAGSAAPRAVATARQLRARRRVLPPTRAADRSRNLALVTGVAPVAISLVSLLLSLYTIVDANRDPSVSLTLPDIVRVAQGQQDAWIYLQPRFVGTGRNQRVAVISDVRLRVEPEQGEPMAFTWDEQGTWQFSTEDKSLTWIYLADPAPLVVSQSTPQLPINLYVGPEGWEWAPGTYLLVVEADQSTTDEVLRAAVRITLYPGGIERIQADRGANLIDVVTEPA